MGHYKLTDSDFSSDDGDEEFGDGDVAPDPPLLENDLFGRGSKNRKQRHRVWLHVYDLEAITGRLNDLILRDANLGAFHTGVEILGSEYYYACADFSGGSGLFCNQLPKVHPVHMYRESVFMGETPLSTREIKQLILDCCDAWPSIEYHPISKNCVTFAEELLISLRVPEPFPAWVRGVSEAVKSPMIYPIADWSWQWFKWWHLSNSSAQSEEAIVRR